MRCSPVARVQASSVPASFGAERFVCSQSLRSSMSCGISVRQVRIGWPKTRTLRPGAAWAATDSPKGPAPTTATSIASRLTLAR